MNGRLIAEIRAARKSRMSRICRAPVWPIARGVLTIGTEHAGRPNQELRPHHRWPQSILNIHCTTSASKAGSQARMGQSKRMSAPVVASAANVTSESARALSVLNSVFGLPGFRGAQEEIVRHVVGGGNCLGLMPTGGGKSLR